MCNIEGGDGLSSWITAGTKQLGDNFDEGNTNCEHNRYTTRSAVQAMNQSTFDNTYLK